MADASITSNYVGKQALPYVAPAILAADTIANNYVTVLNNVRGRAQLRKFSGSQIQAATCTFTTGTALALADVALSLTDLQINDQICNKDLHMAWESEQMIGAAAPAPADMKAGAAQYVAKRAAEAIEFNIWQGNYNIDGGVATSATYTAFNGLLRQMVLASPTYEANLTASLSAANIIAKLQDLVTDRCPPVLRGDTTAIIYMSRSTKALYYSALAATYNLYVSEV